MKAITIEFTETVSVEDLESMYGPILPMVVFDVGQQLSGVARPCIEDVDGIPVECFCLTEASGRTLGPIPYDCVRVVE